MSWFGALIDVLFGGPVTDTGQEYREDGLTAYTAAWLERRSSGASEDTVLTSRFDLFDTFRNDDGSANHPQVLLDAWHENLPPASVKRLLGHY